MSFQPVKTALKYVSAWSLVAGFAALLTIIFNFLGSLFCAALGGMMMGATKASWKLSLPFSLLCPGILLGVLRAQKTELPDRQITVLVMLCLVAFWGIYFAAAALMAQEQTSAIATSGTVSPALNGELATAAAQLARSQPTEEPRCDVTAQTIVATVRPALDQFDGHWHSDECSVDGGSRQRVLDIKEGMLLLSAQDPEGHLCARVRARLENAEWADARRLVVSGSIQETDVAWPVI